MRAGDSASVAAFEAGVQAVPNIVQAYRLFGGPDYQLLVSAASKQHYQQLYDDSLSQLPGVQRLTSTLVMKTIVARHTPVSATVSWGMRGR